MSKKTENNLVKLESWCNGAVASKFANLYILTDNRFYLKHSSFSIVTQDY